MNTLYEVAFINQETGDVNTKYVVAPGLAAVDAEFADITNVEVLGSVEILGAQS